MLTLALAAVILMAAFVLRALVLGAIRLGTFVWRRTHEPVGKHRAPRLDQALPRVTLRERAQQAGRATVTLMQYLAALAAPAARTVRDEVRRQTIAFSRWARAETARFYGWLRVETEDAYSGDRGRTTYQAIGESPTTWGGRPHAVLTRR